jgi:EAL domain-containing protein (putative c-di-GMP-specific phosphodiesterase class I)
MYPDDGTNVNTLIKNADIAMYLAKEKGKNNFQYYSPDLNDKVSRKVDLENGLRKALHNNELELYYQPQIDLRSHQIIEIEALLRWNNPDLGMISPSEFIPLAEETGLIVSIGEWVLKTACAQNKAWQEAGFARLPISINVSRCQLMYSDYKETIRNTLLLSGLEPKYLDIEISERIMQEINNMAMSLSEIKSLGVKISIDDFGTGCSSLNILRNLHIDNLKIDMSFINDITTNKKTIGIIKSIIDMGHALDLNVIAEGVEQELQYTILKDNLCDCIQGYYFSRPLPAHNMETFWHAF